MSLTDFSCSEIGAQISVTLTGVDESGNMGSCTSFVTVLDNISPTINVKTYNLILNNAETAVLLPSNVDNGSFDNCGVLTLTVSPDTC